MNRTRPLLKTGGKQAMLGVKVLQRCLNDLHNWKDLEPNTMALQARRKLDHVCKDIAAGLSGVDLGTGKLLRGVGMEYAADKTVREIMAPGRASDCSCNLLSALEDFDASPSRLSGAQSSEGETAIVGQECPRLRPFKVGDIPIPMPAEMTDSRQQRSERTLWGVPGERVYGSRANFCFCKNK